MLVPNLPLVLGEISHALHALIFLFFSEVETFLHQEDLPIVLSLDQPLALPPIFKHW